MISKIFFTNALPFVEGQGSILNLKKINTFYGSNGSGKTTLSRLIAGTWEQAKVNISWENDLVREVLVFNRDFIKNNFSPRFPLKGIFIIGEELLELDALIQKTRDEIIELETKRNYLHKNLNGSESDQGKKSERKSIIDGYSEKFYMAKREFGSFFAAAYKGHHSTKKKFMEKLIAEYRTNASELKSLDYLIRQSTELANARTGVLEYLQDINFDTLLKLENAPILTEIIKVEGLFGFSKLIDELKNSKWVYQGIYYYKQKPNICPFCQQEPRESLEADLEEAFGNNYKKKTEGIRFLYSSYQLESQKTSSYLEKLLNSDNEQIDKTSLHKTMRLFEKIIRQNLIKIEEKIINPETPIKLVPLNEVIGSIKLLIRQTNQLTYKTNQQFENRKAVSNELSKQIWKYTVSMFQNDINNYVKEVSEIEKQIEYLEFEITKVEQEIRERKLYLQHIEAKTANIQPAIDGINSLLELFGFTNFKVVQLDNRYYKIERLDKSDALMTLSEGEGRLLSFLYYYYLINGGHTKKDISKDKIVVIDDPTSGLDNHSKFIVSSLIRRLIFEVKNGESQIKQVFILSHDMQFLQHIQPNANFEGGFRDKEQGFWLIKKQVEGASIMNVMDVAFFDLEALLWGEIQVEGGNSQATKAVLIQILENYFYRGDESLHENMSLMFEGIDRQIFYELCPWLEARSLNFEKTKIVKDNYQSINKYFDVFKQVFEKSGNLWYFYKMSQFIQS